MALSVLVKVSVFSADRPLYSWAMDTPREKGQMKERPVLKRKKQHATGIQSTKLFCACTRVFVAQVSVLRETNRPRY